MTTQDTDNRLGPEEWDPIDARMHETIARWANRSHTNAITLVEHEHGETLRRLALGAIGCTPHDLTTAELEAIAAHIERVYLGRTWRRHLTRWNRAVDLSEQHGQPR